MSKEYTPHTVIDGIEYLAEDENGDVYGGQWQQEFLKEPEDMITIGYHTDPMRGPRRPSQYTIESLYDHMLINGMSGYGTSTLVRNIQSQLIERGHGITFLDKRGDDSKHLLKNIPEDRLDDVIYIEPATGKKSITFNILETVSNLEDDIYDYEVNQRTDMFISMLKEKSEYWGPQIGNITETIVRELIRAEEPFNAIDLVKIITDEEERKLFADKYGSRLEMPFLKRIDEEDDDAFEPILRRIREWVSDRETRQFISATNSSVNLAESIKENKIIILDTSNIAYGSTLEFVNWAFLNHLWNTIKVIKENGQSSNHFLFLDQCDSIESALSSNINTLISHGSNYQLGVISIVQRLNDLDDDNVKSSVRQSRNTITLNVGPDPSTTGSVAQLFSINADRISDLDRFEAISKVMSKEGYTSEDVVNINLFSEFQPRREEVDSIIESSVDKYSVDVEMSLDLDTYGVSRFSN